MFIFENDVYAKTGFSAPLTGIILCQMEKKVSNTLLNGSLKYGAFELLYLHPVLKGMALSHLLF